MFYSADRVAKEIEHSEKIILSENDIVSYGSNRICYLYKKNPRKLIKTARHPDNWKNDHKQSFSECCVSEKVASKTTSVQITLCQEWVNTNKGPGLLVDRIVDDKGQSLTLRKLLSNKEVTVQSSLELVEDVIKNLSFFGIPASDFNIDNFILEGDIRNKKLVMIDGFSPKRINLKFFLLLHSKLLANYYTRRKWQKAKSRFTLCAEKVYAGHHCFAAAAPLQDMASRYSDKTR